MLSDEVLAKHRELANAKTEMNDQRSDIALEIHPESHRLEVEPIGLWVNKT